MQIELLASSFWFGDIRAVEVHDVRKSAEGNSGSTKAIYFTVKRILFNPMVLKIGKVALMHVHKMSNECILEFS